MALLAAILQPCVDNQAILAHIASDAFDIDSAVGAQLDIIGQWVGASRNVRVPLTGIYFSWGTTNLGWGQGTWQGPYDPTSGLVQLPDDSYRTLLRVVIARNQWDGTLGGAYAIWEMVFEGQDGQILIVDNQDMTFEVIFIGEYLNAVAMALISNQYFDLCPAGVRIIGYFQPSVEGAPVFGWGIQNGTIAGWGAGAWILKIAAGNSADGIVETSA